MSKGTPRRTVRVEDELWNEAQKAAEQNDDNLSNIIREALISYISKH